MSLRLGIDTGGTFTDAVLLDDAERVIASAKALTTRHDLAVGVGEAVRRVRALAPGEVTGFVHGSRSVPYRVRLEVRQLRDDEWDGLLDAVAAKVGHAAALLDGELDTGILEDAHAAGVDLLPVAGDLRSHCSCPDWANPCKHVAALCYLTADLLDDDPFALLLLRGRDRDTVLRIVDDEFADGAQRLIEQLERNGMWR